MRSLKFWILANILAFGATQVHELELSETFAIPYESCVTIIYSFKTCDAATFIYEIGEQFGITLKRKICEFNNVFTLDFESKDLGKQIKSKINIKQRMDSELNILFRFKLDEILTILYNCYYMVNNQIYLEIHIINATYNRVFEYQNDANDTERYSDKLIADHRTVLKKGNEYKEIDSNDIDEFFSDCFYESKNYFYGILACFGVGFLYLIVLYLSRRFIYDRNN